MNDAAAEACSVGSVMTGSGFAGGAGEDGGSGVGGGVGDDGGFDDGGFAGSDAGSLVAEVSVCAIFAVQPTIPAGRSTAARQASGAQLNRWNAGR